MQVEPQNPRSPLGFEGAHLLGCDQLLERFQASWILGVMVPKIEIIVAQGAATTY